MDLSKAKNQQTGINLWDERKKLKNQIVSQDLKFIVGEIAWQLICRLI